MTAPIPIGNQTAFSAEHPMDPFEFAVRHGFDAFEWFSDEKTGDDGEVIGWSSARLDGSDRAEVARLGRERGIRFSVHAPWRANPLEPDGVDLLQESLDFADEIGAALVNLHLFPERGPVAFAQSLRPVIEEASRRGLALSLENVPRTGSIPGSR